MKAGWYNKGSAYQSKRHALAAQGIKTVPVNLTTFGFPAMGRPTPEQEEKEIQESKRQSEMTVKQTGEAIVDRLKGLNHPLIKSVVLDDFDVVAGRLAAIPGVAPDGKPMYDLPEGRLRISLKPGRTISRA